MLRNKTQKILILEKYLRTWVDSREIQQVHIIYQIINQALIQIPNTETDKHK